MKEPLLIADDDPDVISALRYLLQTEGYEVTAARTPAEVLETVKSTDFLAVLLDLNYRKDTTSGREGLALIEQLGKMDIQAAIIAMTAWGSIETAVKAMQAGARDFIQKPWENERLISIVNNQIRLVKAERKTQKLVEENKLLRGELDREGEAFYGQSAAMRRTMAELEQVAASDATLLLTGENGTGKSFLVNRIHGLSPRRDNPLIKVNMGCITETLFESEMFGHVKGSFTDARKTRIGRFELAEGGTLFLDEIGNTPYSQQAKLLRVLEDHRFEKVGASQTQVADCRLIFATNCDLDRAVIDGSFRKDLLYRINTVVIEVPPLRHRQEDILPLADYFLTAHGRKYHKPDLALSHEARQALQRYPWPGNVRELTHILERAAILAKQSIDRDLLGLGGKGPGAFEGAGCDSETENGAAPDWRQLTLEQVEKQVIRNRLDQYPADGSQAARTLGLSKSAFYRHLKKHDLK
ncbi:MAG: sigma-54 dependent transcriptional regulator [Pseudomonadales bacterium]|nr:sigma-54 dependent transcriptional regulator [Pseudomonadales bacterium]